jgi:hypothetical protein
MEPMMAMRLAIPVLEMIGEVASSLKITTSKCLQVSKNRTIVRPNDLVTVMDAPTSLRRFCLTTF